MAPFYRGFQSRPKLETDDIKGIQALYGQKSTKTDDDDDDSVESNVIDTEEPKEKNELCKSNTKIDAIVTTKDTNTYVFKGNKVNNLYGHTI